MITIPPPGFRSSCIGPHPLCGRVVRHVALLCALAFWPGSALSQGNHARLLTTYANPTPAHSDLFGAAVAAFGTDRLLVGTDGAGGYLFSTSGALLTTFTISDPAAFGFGNPIAAAGSDGVLIGAYSYGTTAQNGRAYLFRTNGALQTTFTNPAPATVQAFGLSAAAFGGDRVLIGGLHDLPYPSLSIARSTTMVSLTWVTSETGLTLQQSGVLGTRTTWGNSTDAVSVSGLTNLVQLPLGNTNLFYRLHRP